MCNPTMQVESCDKRQRNNKKLKTQPGNLHPVPVTPKIWHQVGMDLIGPLPKSHSIHLNYYRLLFKMGRSNCSS